MDFITFFETVEKSDFEDGDILWTKAYNFDPPNAHGVQGVVKFENDTWKIHSVLTSNPSQKHLVWPAQLRWKLSVVKNNNIKAVDGRDNVTWNKDEVGKCDWTDCIKISHDDLQRDELVDTDGFVTFMWFVELAVAFSLSTTGETREAISEYSSEETVDTTDDEGEAQDEESQDAKASQLKSITQEGADDKTSIPSAKFQQRSKGDGKEDKAQSSKYKRRISRLEQDNKLKDNSIKKLKNDIEQKDKTYKSHNAQLQAENERLRTESVEDEGEIEVEPTRRDVNKTRSNLLNYLIICEKNPKHKDFIPVGNFHLQHLPKSHRDQMYLDYIMAVISLTVRLVVSYVSCDRPYKYPLSRDRGRRVRVFASGKVIRALRRFTDVDDKSCPCPQCETLDPRDRKTQWAKFLIATAGSVVYDEEEARHTQVDIDYNTVSDRDICLKIHGLSVRYCNTEEDLCPMSCVTHDRDVALMLEERVRRYNDLRTKLENKYSSFGPTDSKPVVIVSHPHGMSKHISVGEWRGQQEEKPYRWRYTTATCPGSGGAPVCVLGNLQGKYISVSTHSRYNRDTGYNESGSDGLLL